MIAVLGANGMAGHIISKYLRSIGENITTVARHSADINMDFEVQSETHDLVETIKSTDIKFVVNCIGLLVQESIARPDRAIVLNSWLPRYLEQELKHTNVRILHISTDCVFDGSVGGYIESDVPNETNIYGRSKAIGEIYNNKDITFRTSIIGPEIKSNGSGLFDWFLHKSSDRVNGWDDVFWSGVTSLELARCIHKWIEEPKLTGLFHLTNNKKISKYELLTMISEIFEVNKNIIRAKGPKLIDKSLIDTRGTTLFRVKEYQKQLLKLKSFMEI